MILTPTQLQVLATDIAASEFAGLPGNSDSAEAIAQAYNLPATPAFTVWREEVGVQEIKANILWADYITATPGLQMAFELMIADGTINPSDPNIRQGFAAIFSGTTLTQLTAMAKRAATRAERIFATGTGSTGSPGTMVGSGPLSGRDILQAWNS